MLSLHPTLLQLLFLWFLLLTFYGQTEGVALEGIIGEREHFPRKKWVILFSRWVNSLANINKGGPGVGLDLPAFQHQAVKKIGAVIWLRKMLTSLHMGQNLLVGKPLIGQLCQCGNLPKHNAIAPHIWLAWELSIANWFGSHPTNRHGSSAICAVVICHVHISRHS